MKSIVITACASIDSAVEAMRRGAFEYLPKPFTHEQVIAVVGKVARVRSLEQKVADLQEMLNEAAPETVFESVSPARGAPWRWPARWLIPMRPFFCAARAGPGKP